MDYLLCFVVLFAANPVFGWGHMKFPFEIAIELSFVFITQRICDLRDRKSCGRQKSGGFLHLYFVAVML